MAALSNKGMKLTKPGELRSFAAYPRCSTDQRSGVAYFGYVHQRSSRVTESSRDAGCTGRAELESLGRVVQGLWLAQASQRGCPTRPVWQRRLSLNLVRALVCGVASRQQGKVQSLLNGCRIAPLLNGSGTEARPAWRTNGLRSNKGMKLTKPGELRSFAAYPRCSMDSRELKQG